MEHIISANELIKSSLIPSLIINSSGEITLINESASLLFGYASNELIGENIEILISKSLHKKHVKLRDNYHKKPVAMPMGKRQGLRGVKKDGDFVLLEISLWPMKTAGKKFTMATIKDVTMLLSAQEELKKSVIELEKLNEDLEKTQEQLVQAAKLASLGEMASGLAHELNNPLLYVNGFAELINKSLTVHNEITADEQEELAGYSEYLLDGTHKMARIIDDFRAFARQDEKIKEPTSVNTAITKAITLLENQLKLAAIEVELKILEEDQQFLGDSVKLEQVLVNLLTNARDALEGVAKKKIEVSAEIKGKNIEIRVSDNGPGIKEDLLTKILDPFFTTKEVGRGTGLGLSVSHGIIESFEGNLTVANNKNGAGCAFTISLPLL